MKKLALILILCSCSLGYAEKARNMIQKKATLCASCHGAKGISPTSLWPNLAAQHKSYLQKQLKEMQQGTLRKVPSMAAVLATLSDQDIDDLSAYYAKMPMAYESSGNKSSDLGERLYKTGAYNKQIPACIICHGPKGAGNAETGFPMLSSQQADYTVLQLQAFKQGLRTNDPSRIMQEISSKMSQEEMAAVAHYIEGLH